MPTTEHRPYPPVIYTAEGVEFVVGPIIGDPATFTYRVAWSQVIPKRLQFWQPDMLPTVTVDRTILVKHGTGEANRWGTPCILSIVALQTATLCCVNVQSTCYTHAYRMWWYCRITDREVRTINWDELTRKECDLLTSAVGSEPLRSKVGGRSAEHRRAPVIYKYPVRAG